MDPNERREEANQEDDEGEGANGNEGGGGEGDSGAADVGNDGEGEGGDGDGDGGVPEDDVVDGNDIDIDNEEMPYANWALRLADEPLPENVLHVMAQVLQNDMLVENILEKIILDNERASIRSCRLVSKQWLCAIAKLYRKMKRPQFIVNTSSRDNALLNEPRPRPFFEQHTLLYEFIKPMARHDRIEGFIPTFSLTLGASYFRKSNYTDFVNCLVQCGPSLVELYIRFPKNSAMSFLLPPAITLPNLNTFGISFSGQSLLGHNFPMAYHHQHDYFPNNCSIHLVQTILNASANLRRLQFMSCPNPMNPPDMENLYLPDSLTSIYIDTPFRDFELFLRKNLPYLTEIRINATIALYSEENIYDLFSKLCPTLKTVWLTGSAGTRRSLPIRLPKMEHLTKFVMFKPWEFEERNPPTSFEETFPVLETLVFANQTEYSFSYLMSGMRSTTVTSFCVWLTSLRLHPPVMNFPPAGLPVGDDQPPRNLAGLAGHRAIILGNVPGHVQPMPEPMNMNLLQERRERMRHALQQMRLDIMERHHRRVQRPGGGDEPAAVGNDDPPLPPPRLREDPRLMRRANVPGRPGAVAVEERERERRRNDDIEVIRVIRNNNANAVDVEPLPEYPFARPVPALRWEEREENPEPGVQRDRYWYMAERARAAMMNLNRMRVRNRLYPGPGGGVGDGQNAGGAARGDGEAIPGGGDHPPVLPVVPVEQGPPVARENPPQPRRMRPLRPLPHEQVYRHHRIDIGVHHRPPNVNAPPGVQVVIERVRPPYHQDEDMLLNQPPRVVIRRLGEPINIGGGWRAGVAGCARPGMIPFQLAAMNPPHGHNPHHQHNAIGVQIRGRQNNEAPGGGPAGEDGARAVPPPPPPRRPAEVELNPIRAVYQRILDRMEVDREDVDNAIHRAEERHNQRDMLIDEGHAILDRMEAAGSGSDDDEDDDSDNEPDHNYAAAGGANMVRRLEVLAAVAVANRREALGENNNENQEEEELAAPPNSPPPIQELEVNEPPGDVEVVEAEAGDGVGAGVGLVNDAVREAYRIIRENENLLPEHIANNPYLVAPPPPAPPPPAPPAVVAPAVPAAPGVDGAGAGLDQNVAQRRREPGRPPGGEGGDDIRAAIGGVRRRLRQQEARNLRDLRQLRHRMLMDWAHPRGRHAPPGGAAGAGGLHVPLPERPVTMTKEKMQSINIAFPNLVKLTINISGPETCGLKYIFEEMRSLQSLRVIVENSLWTIKWDSLLTGIPQDFCDAVRSSTELWDEVYLNENHVSIRNMTKLEELMLLECIKVDEHREQSRSLDDRYISDVAFHFGLLKMKELKHVTVTPGFSPSPQMYCKWYEEKGYKVKVRPRARLDVSYYEYH